MQSGLAARRHEATHASPCVRYTDEKYIWTNPLLHSCLPAFFTTTITPHAMCVCTFVYVSALALCWCANVVFQYEIRTLAPAIPLFYDDVVYTRIVD